MNASCKGWLTIVRQLVYARSHDFKACMNALNRIDCKVPVAARRRTLEVSQRYVHEWKTLCLLYTSDAADE